MEKTQMMSAAFAILLFIAGILVGTYVVADTGEGDDDGNSSNKTVTFDEPYEPAIDPSDYVAGIDNPYFPLVPGSEWIYEGQTEDGIERIEFRVLEETRTVMGVECTVVRDTVTVDGELVEDTYDWYAQDVAGNVWYFGEDSKDYENGKVVSTKGSWESGASGAFPGIMMLADPYVGMTYRQEYLVDEAEDMGTILSLDESITVRGSSYTGVIKIRDFTPLDPDNFAYKYYAPGIGVVLEVEGEERVELIEFNPP